MCRVDSCKKPLAKGSSYFCGSCNEKPVSFKRQVLGIKPLDRVEVSEEQFVVHGASSRGSAA